MKKLFVLAPLVLVGCASHPVGQTLMVEKEAHPLSRGEQIEAMHE